MNIIELDKETQENLYNMLEFKSIEPKKPAPDEIEKETPDLEDDDLGFEM